MSDADDDLDPRISSNRQISFTRPPKLSNDLAKHYPYQDTEQDIIKQAMRDMLSLHDRGLTPTDLVSKLEVFVAATSGRFAGRVDENGTITLRCQETGSELRFGETDDEVAIDVDLESDQADT